MNPDNALKYICEAEATKPKKWVEPSKEDKRKKAEAEDRKMFYDFAAKNGIEVS